MRQPERRFPLVTLEVTSGKMLSLPSPKPAVRKNGANPNTRERSFDAEKRSCDAGFGIDRLKARDSRSGPPPKNRDAKRLNLEEIGAKNYTQCLSNL